MSEKQETVGLVWFWNDLRTHDHEALATAVERCDRVIACYFFDPRWYGETSFGFPKTGSYRAQFIVESVENLVKNLARKNISCITSFGSAEVEISRLVEKYSIDIVFTHREITSEERAVQRAVEQSLSDEVAIHYSFGMCLHHVRDVPFHVKDTPAVFTAFRKKVEKYSTIRELISVHSMPTDNMHGVEETHLPSLNDLGLDTVEPDDRTAFPFRGGEDAGLSRVQSYFWESNNVKEYKETRNGMIGADYSTKFSPWLAIGALSPRTIYHTLKEYESERGSNRSTYWVVFELLWRDFFKYVSIQNGNAIFQKDGLHPRHWKNEKPLSLFKKWQKGETFHPFINAHMKELLHTGWMGNRGRQCVASYLVNDLSQDWRRGASWFESQLLDYDPTSNWCNWMYVAGVGNDPRSDRYFHPDKQAGRYDPEGAFQALWNE